MYISLFWQSYINILSLFVFMNTEVTKELTRQLINKIYNSPYITDDILIEIEKDIEKITPKNEDNTLKREIKVLCQGAKKQDNKIVRNNFRFAFLSNLEKEYKRLCSTETLVTQKIKS